MDLALQNKTLLLLPLPHITLKYQPLEVGLFGALGHFMNAKVAKEAYVAQSILSKIGFIQIYAEVRRNSMTEQGIRGSFRHAAIWPTSQRKMTQILLHLQRRINSNRKVTQQRLSFSHHLHNRHLKQPTSFSIRSMPSWLPNSLYRLEK